VAPASVKATAATNFTPDFCKPRRKWAFRESLSNLATTRVAPRALQSLLPIRKLYDVETQALGRPPAERVALHQQYAKPIFDELEIWLKAQQGNISGKMPLGKAIRYALARLSKARAYLNNGFLEMDNNTAERAVRPIAVGRKNYLFMGSEAGGKDAA